MYCLFPVYVCVLFSFLYRNTVVISASMKYLRRVMRVSLLGYLFQHHVGRRLDACDIPKWYTYIQLLQRVS